MAALPLLVSDLAFLMGVQILLLGLGILGGWLPVALTHFLFVFPYVLLALAGPWARLDPRYERAARCLGASSLRTLLRVRLPLLLPAIAFAAALGFAVSLSLYLPTVLTGGGRIATLATEAIALSSGGDRRIIGVYGATQAVLIWLGFLLAWLTRRGLAARSCRDDAGMAGASPSRHSARRCAVVRTLDLVVRPGRPLTIMGPSGAGKSSLLSWLTGMLPEGLTGRGDVLLDGRSIVNEPPIAAAWASCFRTTCSFHT